MLTMRDSNNDSKNGSSNDNARNAKNLYFSYICSGYLTFQVGEMH